MDNWGPEPVEASQVTLGITGAGLGAVMWGKGIGVNLCGSHGSASCCYPLAQGWAVFRRLKWRGRVQRQARAFCARSMGSGSESLVGAPLGTPAQPCVYQTSSLSLPPSRLTNVASIGKYPSTGVFFYWARSMATRATRRAEQGGRNHGPLKTRVTFCQQAPGPRTRLEESYSFRGW